MSSTANPRQCVRSPPATFSHFRFQQIPSIPCKTELQLSSVVRIFWSYSVMTCQQYVITHLLDPRDLSQILPTGKAASNEPTSSRSHLSTVVPGGSHTVLHVLDDAAQRQRAPLVFRTHIFTRISSWTVSYPRDFLSAREPQTSASLAKRRRTHRNIFCPVSPRAGALLRCKLREFFGSPESF